MIQDAAKAWWVVCIGVVPPCGPQVALVVLDSATFHFRQDFTDAAQRSRLMLSMAQQLAQLAEQRGVAVVMVNQVSQGPGNSVPEGFGSIHSTLYTLHTHNLPDPISLPYASMTTCCRHSRRPASQRYWCHQDHGWNRFQAASSG